MAGPTSDSMTAEELDKELDEYAALGQQSAVNPYKDLVSLDDVASRQKASAKVVRKQSVAASKSTAGSESAGSGSKGAAFPSKISAKTGKASAKVARKQFASASKSAAGSKSAGSDSKGAAFPLKAVLKTGHLKTAAAARTSGKKLTAGKTKSSVSKLASQASKRSNKTKRSRQLYGDRSLTKESKVTIKAGQRLLKSIRRSKQISPLQKVDLLSVGKKISSLQDLIKKHAKTAKSVTVAGKNCRSLKRNKKRGTGAMQQSQSARGKNHSSHYTSGKTDPESQQLARGSARGAHVCRPYHDQYVDFDDPAQPAGGHFEHFRGQYHPRGPFRPRGPFHPKGQMRPGGQYMHSGARFIRPRGHFGYPQPYSGYPQYPYPQYPYPQYPYPQYPEPYPPPPQQFWY